MNKYRIIALTVFLALSVFLFFYNDNNQYLDERSADKAWFEFLPTLKEVVKKGDQISYVGNQAPNGADERWTRYEENFSRHIKIFNTNNAPVMRNSYILTAAKQDVGVKYKIIFTMAEKNTSDVVEQKEILSETIKAKSMIPAVAAIILCFIILNPIISLLISICIGSILHNNSILLGVEQVVYKYIPLGVSGDGFRIIIFLAAIHFLLRLLAYSGSVKSLTSSRSKLFTYAPMALMTVHPYVFSSMGAWWFSTITKKPMRVTRSSFIAQSLSLIFSSLFILSPYLFYILSSLKTQTSGISFYIGMKDLFIQTLPFRFFSFSLLLVVICYVLFDKQFIRTNDQQRLSDNSVFVGKSMVKRKIFIPLCAAILMFSVVFIVAVFRHHTGLGALGLIMVSTLISALLILLMVLKERLMNIMEAITIFKTAIKESLPFMFLLVLSSIFANVLVDIGVPHY
ncbi:MAG: hypothetical protein V1647_05330, partial [Pseudomonadota bacterium]